MNDQVSENDEILVARLQLLKEMGAGHSLVLPPWNVATQVVEASQALTVC